MNRTHRIVAVILGCTMVVLLGMAQASTNEPRGADASAGTITDADVGSLQMLAGDSFLAAQSAAADTIYVDWCAEEGGDGSVGNPYNTLTFAVSEASPGDTIVMQGGSYTETLDITKALTITASDGPALVGEYYVGSREVSIPVTVCPDCTGGLPFDANAKVYYPATRPGAGTPIACGGEFPAVVYAHGRRDDDWGLCEGWNNPGPADEDYRQAEGILTRLAASGIIAISVDHSSQTAFFRKGPIVINTIAYLRDEDEEGSGSWLEGAVDLARVGLSGHSTGGAAAIYAALNLHEPAYDQLNLDSVQIQGLGLLAPTCTRVTGGSCLQGGVPSGVGMLVIHGTRDPCQVGNDPVEVYREANPPKYLVVVTGANHFGYTDGICLEPVEDCDDGWDFSSEVGGVDGQDAHARQQRTARNYVHAFFAHSLQDKDGAIDYLIQDWGPTCDHGVPPCSDPGLPPNCGCPQRLFDDLENLNVEVDVCWCEE